MTPPPRAAAGPLAALGLAALLAGCASMAPPYQRPPAPVPAQFPDAGAAPAGAPAEAAADIPWPQFFADPRLRRLIGTALQNNRDLRVAALNIEQAQAQAALRDADRWPTLGAGVTGLRQPNGNGGINSVYTAGLQLSSYELDLFGRLRSLGDAAAAQVLASAEARKAVQIGLVASVAGGWFALLADDALLQVTQSTLATRIESARLTQLRYDHGAASELDLQAAVALREAARVALAQQTRQRAQDENALALLLGQPVPADALPTVAAVASTSSDRAGPAPEPALTTLPTLPDLPPGLPASVLTRRPDVRQAELQLVAANANIGAARAAFFPRITLTGSAGSASNALAGLFKAGSFAWSAAPQALATVFDAGRNRANLKLAEVGREIALAQYERAIQSAFREVADALAGRATLQQQLQAQQAQVQAQQALVRLTALRYRNGAASALDLLDAQRVLFTAQQAAVQVQALVAQNGVTLYRVLGGGWAPGAALP